MTCMDWRWCGSLQVCWRLCRRIFQFSLRDWASQVALVVKNLPANAGDVRDVGLTPGSEDPLEEEMATHSSVLAGTVRCLQACRTIKL